MNEIYRNIEKLRRNGNLTQVELANKLGISRSAVNAWEMGISKPHIDHVIAMAEIFHVNIDRILLADSAKYLLDISDLTERERKIITDLAAALRESRV